MKINNIIKLKDEDCMHTHAFCPSCHYWLFNEDKGVNYCPHCGIKLFWNSKKMSKVHENWYEISIKRYNQLKNNIKNKNIIFWGQKCYNVGRKK